MATKKIFLGGQNIVVDADTGELIAKLSNDSLRNLDLVLAASRRLTVTNTSASLQTKFGQSLPAGTVAISLIPEDETAIRMEMGAAAGEASARISVGGEILPITLADANALQLYCEVETHVALRCYVPRS